jgi:hypothetical protein
MNKDEKEFMKVWEYLTTTAMEKMNITRRTAELRINAIRKSGILTELGDPDGQPFQIGIDVAMRIPQLGEKED